jgi:hypothetical protein
MASAILTEPMTTEDLLDLPDDGTERWLLRGELREKPRTVRNRWHSKVHSAAWLSRAVWGGFSRE